MCLEAPCRSRSFVSRVPGGMMPEFVESDCGFVVPYLDVMAMVDRLVYLLNFSNCRLTMVGAAIERIISSR
jgi:hypothetical protein